MASSGEQLGIWEVEEREYSRQRQLPGVRRQECERGLRDISEYRRPGQGSIHVLLRHLILILKAMGIIGRRYICSSYVFAHIAIHLSDHTWKQIHSIGWFLDVEQHHFRKTSNPVKPSPLKPEQLSFTVSALQVVPRISWIASSGPNRFTSKSCTFSSPWLSAQKQLQRLRSKNCW